MLLNSFLNRFEEDQAEARVRSYVSSATPEPERAEFLGHFLRSEYQPILERTEGGFGTVSFEAFVRPAAGDQSISPAEFFESLGLEDRSLVDRISRELHVTNFLKSAQPTEELSLNVSPSSLEAQLESFQDVEKQLSNAAAAGLHPHRINLELPVSADLDPGVVYTFATHLKMLGVKITLEDFDCDHASLSRVNFIRPDVVKFNRSWLDGNLQDTSYRNMVAAVVSGIRALGSKTHQERIETQAEAQFAASCGIDRLQGYYISSPTAHLSYPYMEFPPAPAPAPELQQTTQHAQSA